MKAIFTITIDSETEPQAYELMLQLLETGTRTFMVEDADEPAPPPTQIPKGWDSIDQVHAAIRSQIQSSSAELWVESFDAGNWHVSTKDHNALCIHPSGKSLWLETTEIRKFYPPAKKGSVK